MILSGQTRIFLITVETLVFHYPNTLIYERSVLIRSVCLHTIYSGYNVNTTYFPVFDRLNAIVSIQCEAENGIATTSERKLCSFNYRREI